MSNKSIPLQFKCYCGQSLKIINEPFYAGFDEEPVYITKLKCDSCGIESMWAIDALDAHFSITEYKKNERKEVMYNDGSGIVQVFVGGVYIGTDVEMLEILKKTFLTSKNKRIEEELKSHYEYMLEEEPKMKYNRKKIVEMLFEFEEDLYMTLEDLEEELGLLSFVNSNGYCYIGEVMEFQGVFESELTEEQIKYLIENGKAFLKLHNIDEGRFRLYHFTNH